MESASLRDWMGRDSTPPLDGLNAQEELFSYTFEELQSMAKATLTLQRAFRGAKARQACATALTRAKIFGGASYLCEGNRLPPSNAPSGPDAMMRTRTRGRKERNNDKEFRDVLKNSIIEGYEDLYLHYTVIEEEMSLVMVHQADIVTNDPSSSSTAAAESLSPLLEDASRVIARDAVDCFRSELERVDVKFEAAVEEVVAILQMIKREAAPKNKLPGNPDGRLSSLSKDPRGHDTLQKMQIGLNRGLKAALKDLYKKMWILIQIASLNYVGFRKLEVRMEEMLGLDRCARACVPTREEIRSRRFFLQMSDVASETTEAFFQAMDETEAMFSHLFTQGDMTMARSYLRSFQNTPPTVRQSVRLGLQGGMALILLAWALWLLLLDSREELECPFCTEYLSATAPVFRILLVPIVGVWTWAVGVRVWERHNINYSFILQMDLLHNMGSFRYFEIALQLSLMFLICFVTYVSAIRTGWYPEFMHLDPTIYPIITLVIFLLYSTWPTGHSKNLSNYFLAGLSNIVIRPFGSNAVGFAENFIADVLTSMAVVLRDITTVVDFYFCGGASGLPDKEEPQWLRKVQGPLITALPYFWRFMQCMRRAYDAKGLRGSTPHLINAGKYFVSLTSITMAVLGCEHGCKHFYTDKEHWTVGRITWFSALVLGTVYAYIWDIFMDWSLLVVDSDGKRWFFGLLPALRMREKRAYRRTWLYWFAAVSNLGGRLMWALSISPFSTEVIGAYPQVYTTIVAVVELMRRGQWSLLRIENEHMTNASGYRSISDVPVMIAFAELRVGKKHLHTGEEEDGRLSMKQLLLIALSIAMAAGAGVVVWLQTAAQA